MNNTHQQTKTVAISTQVLLATYLLLPATAFAYVDPGSGSVIVTTILGFFAAIGYTFRKFFYNMKRRLTNPKPADEQGSTKNNDDRNAS